MGTAMKNFIHQDYALEPKNSEIYSLLANILFSSPNIWSAN